METTIAPSMAQSAIDGKSLVILAVDVPGSEPGRLRRGYFACLGSELEQPAPRTREWIPGSTLPGSEGRARIFLFPTRTYSEGLGSDQPSPLAPEDRRMIRLARRATGAEPSVCALGLPGGSRTGAATQARRGFVEFDGRYLADVRNIFASCMTKPNRQDYLWLLTKTFGFNLAVRLAFVIQGVSGGGLSPVRAALSTSWYQLQDAVFTVFGQTYMKFLGKMTGMLRVHNARVGDFAFVYVQLCGFEFLNRLVLGPLGENPLVYSAMGLGLIFVNILQGMLSGGPLIPAINQMRKAGVIGHSTMMHLYQLTSLTMHFGLFATFGYQRFYAALTGGVLLLSWTSYLAFSNLYRDPEFVPVGDAATLAALDRAAAGALRS